MSVRGGRIGDMSDRNEPPRLDVDELAEYRQAVLAHYMGAMPSPVSPRVRAYVGEPDHGLVDLIDMAASLAVDYRAALEKIASLEDFAGRVENSGGSD